LLSWTTLAGISSLSNPTSDAHCPTTQLDRFPIFTRHQLVVLKSLRWLVRCCRLASILGNRRLAGLNPTSESLVKHADRTEFHCSRKLVTATRAGALGLHPHGPTRRSAATRTENNATFHRLVRNRPARSLSNSYPVAQAIVCSFILARQTRFRNKIPAVGVLRCPLLINDLRR
jgi:hypothetical protein